MFWRVSEVRGTPVEIDTSSREPAGDTIAALLRSDPIRRAVLASIRKHGVQAFLVGGTVRDILMDRPCLDDMDIAVNGSAMNLAREVADAVRGAFFPLDPDRDVARVVVGAGQSRQHIDFASLRGGDIVADLQARDFTVNAMAYGLTGAHGSILDPTGGRRDLARRALRAVGDAVFEDDPLRVLRAVRLRGALDFPLTPRTEALAKAAVHGLGRVSLERIRDELFQILSLRRSAEALAYAGGLGAMATILPGLLDSAGGIDEATSSVSVLEGLFDRWVSDPDAPWPDSSANGTWGAAGLGELDHHRESLTAHWRQALSSDRSRWALLKLATLLSVVPGSAADLALHLRLSKREVGHLGLTVAAGTQGDMWHSDASLTPLRIYRYYRLARDAGIDGAILATARRLARKSCEAGQTPDALFARVDTLLRARFQRKGVLVSPPQLLSGHEVMQHLGLCPGPEVGRWLERLREAQVQGLVSSRDDALDYLRSSGGGQLVQ